MNDYISKLKIDKKTVKIKSGDSCYIYKYFDLWSYIIRQEKSKNPCPDQNKNMYILKLYLKCIKTNKEALYVNFTLNK